VLDHFALRLTPVGEAHLVDPHAHKLSAEHLFA
jgi:hypothetical protein